jgi:hypothetical protein
MMAVVVVDAMAVVAVDTMAVVVVDSMVVNMLDAMAAYVMIVVVLDAMAVVTVDAMAVVELLVAVAVGGVKSAAVVVVGAVFGIDRSGDMGESSSRNEMYNGEPWLQSWVLGAVAPVAPVGVHARLVGAVLSGECWLQS